MKRIIAVLLTLVLCISFVACSEKEGGSSEEDNSVVSDKTPLAAKISEVEPLIFGNANEQTRKYLMSAVENAKRHYDDAECTETEMANSISDMEKAAATLKDGTFNPIAIIGMAAFGGAEKGAAPDGTTDAVKFTDSLTSTADPFGGKLVSADGITLHFQADAQSAVKAEELSITLKAGETAFTAKLPVSQNAADLRVSFDCFEGAAGTYLVDVIPSINSITFAAAGSNWISALSAYAEVLETEKGGLSVRASTSVSNEKFYKITDAKGSVLTYGPEITERITKWQETLATHEEGQKLSFSADAGDDTQLWQIYKSDSGTYRIINKGTGLALTTNASFDLFMKEADMTNAKQEFGIKSVAGGIAITYADAYSLATFSTKAVLKKGTSNTVKLTEYDYGSWVLVNSDEFDQETLDRTTWTPDNAKTRGDDEPIFYRDSEKNHYLSNGNLVIKTYIEEYKGYHATSASIDTAGKYAIAYGRVDVRAKVPGGDHIWPAIWMMGDESIWPHDGEIDIMENGWIGDEKTDENIEKSKYLYGTLHWFDDVGTHMSKNYSFPISRDNNLCDDYHIYSVEWDTEQVRILVDGMLYMTLNINNDSMRWGFGSQPHYIILNTSVSGPGNDELPSGMPAESEYDIDYVRFYKRSGEVSVTENISVDAGNASIHKLGSSSPNKIVTSPDGKYTAVVGWGQEILIYSTKKMEVLYKIKGKGNAYTCGAFSPDSKTFVAGSRNGVLTFCETDSGISWDVDNPHVYHEAIAFTSDSANVICGGRNFDGSSSASRKMFVFDASGGSTTQVELESDIRAIASKGNTVALALGNATVKLFDANTFALRATLTGHTSAVRGIDITEDGSRLATSDENGNVFIWDTASGKLAAKMNNTCDAAITKVLFLDGGRRVLCASDSGDARIFTVGTGRLYSLMGGFDSLVKDIAVSRDGSMIAVGAYDGSVRTYTSSGALLEAVKVKADDGLWVGALDFCTNTRLIFGLKNPANGLYAMKLSKK